MPRMVKVYEEETLMADERASGADPIKLEGETWAPPAEDDAAANAPKHTVFIGPQGLRAGWAIAIYMVIVFVASIALSAVAMLGLVKAHVMEMPHRGVHARAPNNPVVVLCSEIGSFLAVLGATWLTRRIERRNFTMALDGPLAKNLTRFVGGAISGFAALSVLILMMKQAGVLVFDGRSDAGHIAYYAIMWALVMLFVALFEETGFRGFLLYTTARGSKGRSGSESARIRRGFWIAAAITSTIFGAVHISNGGESWLGALNAGLIGLVFAYSLWRSGSLWWAVGAHAGWNWGESYLFGVPDSGTLSQGAFMNTHVQGNPLLSGGTVGPEGSLLVLIAIGLLALVVRLAFRQVEWPSHQE